MLHWEGLIQPEIIEGKKKIEEARDIVKRTWLIDLSICLISWPNPTEEIHASPLDIKYREKNLCQFAYIHMCQARCCFFQGKNGLVITHVSISVQVGIASNI